MSTYSVDYWYTCEQQPLRAFPQMTGSANGPEDVQRHVASLREQGYDVQRVVMAEVCVACSGNGRIGKAPKGTRKAKRHTIPAWRMTWTDCDACKGQGTIHATDYAL